MKEIEGRRKEMMRRATRLRVIWCVMNGGSEKMASAPGVS